MTLLIFLGALSLSVLAFELMSALSGGLMRRNRLLGIQTKAEITMPQRSTLSGSTTWHALLGVPAIIQAAQNSIPASGGCGPIGALGTMTGGLIAALAGLRIALSLIGSASAAATGSSPSLAGALLEISEAIFGMVLASAAIPIAAHFLGVC